MLLTKKEKLILSYLRDSLKFGERIFNDYLFNQSTNKKDYKREFIIFHFGAIHNYSDSIYILCKNSKPHSAIVLLRSILEAFINMVYFVNTNSNLKIAKYAIDDLKNNGRTLKQFKNFIAKYPTYKNKYSMTTESNIDSLIIKNQNLVQAFEAGNKFYRSTKIEPDLRKRAEAYDKKVNKPGELELDYLLVYKYFCSFAHISVSGLNNFVKETSSGLKFDITKAKDTEPTLVTTFMIYVTMLNYLKKRRYIPQKIKLTKFNKQIKQFS